MRHAAIFAVFTLGFGAGMLTTTYARQTAPQVTPPPVTPLPAERVTGIGGVFFKAKDPKALAAWYRQALGVDVTPGTPYAMFRWREAEGSNRAGTTAWSLFPITTKYFAPSDSPFMINYRVGNLDAMLAQLKALNVTIDPKMSDDANGKFAWILDPEGNKVELWEQK